MAKTMSVALSDELAAKLLEELRSGAESLGLALSDHQQQQLMDYLKLLVKWNQAYNLTAIRDPQTMLVDHLLDSFSIASFIPEQSRCLDVGTGPGLPGIVLAIARPSTQWLLVDSNGKKTRFVQQAITELGLNNAKVKQTRVENLLLDTPFNIITSRAFSDLSDMVDKTQHLLAENGSILAMKGTYPKDELQNLLLHGKVHTIKVPFMDKQRHLVCITGSPRG